MSHHKEGISVTEEQLQDLLQARTNTEDVPILSHRAEDSVRRQLRDIALRGCASEILKFAECASGKVITVLWKCRSENREVADCMKQFKNDDALRDEIRRRFVNYSRILCV